MACTGKRWIRWGLVGVIIAGTAVAIAEPGRLKALFQQTRSNINQKIDEHITDPVALRQSLSSLQAEYPKRIEEVRGELAEVRSQLASIERDMAISQRVVSLADEDMGKLDRALAMAENTAGQAIVSDAAPREIVIVFKGERFDVEQAYAKRNHVIATRNAYENRVNDFNRDVGYVRQQERQLVNLLGKLETEHTNFLAQLTDLDRQIDAIDRNERMIALMEKRQETLDRQDRYSPHSMDQLNARLADLRARQEAKLAALATGSQGDAYEDAARSQLDREAIAQGLYQRDTSPARATSPARDQFEIDADESEAETSDGGSLAQR